TPVADRLTQNGVDVTALHNHLLGESPHVMYVHIHGHGVPTRLAETVQEVPPAMGVATAINFQPTGEGKAAITGDFVMTPNEVQAVQRTLRANHITITALHSHMTGESPRLLFMHFWAVDDAIVLARGLRAALATEAR